MRLAANGVPNFVPCRARLRGKGLAVPPTDLDAGVSDGSMGHESSAFVCAMARYIPKSSVGPVLRYRLRFYDTVSRYRTSEAAATGSLQCARESGEIVNTLYRALAASPQPCLQSRTRWIQPIPWRGRPLHVPILGSGLETWWSTLFGVPSCCDAVASLMSQVCILLIDLYAIVHIFVLCCLCAAALQ